MRRLGIFSFYDKNGIADDYIFYLLDELMTVCTDLIIIVNGYADEKAMTAFRQYTECVYVRENKGFDAGAYADIIVNMLGEKVRKWDEIVLCNDTFFGPFIPMSEIFDVMEKKSVDFWGLNFVDRNILSHIQSYFLVFGKRITENGELTRYFEENIDPNETELMNLYGKFEIGIFNYFKNKAFVYDTYANTDLCGIYESPDICVKKYGLPILKKKCFSGKYDNEFALRNVISYIKHKMNYKLEYILEYAARQTNFSVDIKKINGNHEYYTDEIKLSKCMYSEIQLRNELGCEPFYIYGAGIIAHEIFHACPENRKGFKGFVISDDQEMKHDHICGYPVFHYNETEKNALVVLGIDKQLSMQIKKKINNEMRVISLWE